MDEGALAEKGGHELFKELLRLIPTASWQDYFKNGLWQEQILRLDIRILLGHRQEAGAPDPTPLSEVVLPPDMPKAVARPATIAKPSLLLSGAGQAVARPATIAKPSLLVPGAGQAVAKPAVVMKPSLSVPSVDQVAKKPIMPGLASLAGQVAPKLAMLLGAVQAKLHKPGLLGKLPGAPGILAASAGKALAELSKPDADPTKSKAALPNLAKMANLPKLAKIENFAKAGPAKSALVKAVEVAKLSPATPIPAKANPAYKAASTMDKPVASTTELSANAKAASAEANLGAAAILTKATAGSSSASKPGATATLTKATPGSSSASNGGYAFASGNVNNVVANDLRQISTFVAKWKLDPMKAKLALARLPPQKRSFVIETFLLNPEDNGASSMTKLEQYIQRCDRSNTWSSAANMDAAAQAATGGAPSPSGERAAEGVKTAERGNAAPAPRKRLADGTARTSFAKAGAKFALASRRFDDARTKGPSPPSASPARAVSGNRNPTPSAAQTSAPSGVRRTMAPRAVRTMAPRTAEMPPRPARAVPTAVRTTAPTAARSTAPRAVRTMATRPVRTMAPRAALASTGDRGAPWQARRPLSDTAIGQGAKRSFSRGPAPLSYSPEAKRPRTEPSSPGAGVNASHRVPHAAAKSGPSTSYTASKASSPALAPSAPNSSSSRQQYVPAPKLPQWSGNQAASGSSWSGSQGSGIPSRPAPMTGGSTSSRSWNDKSWDKNHSWESREKKPWGGSTQSWGSGATRSARGARPPPGGARQPAEEPSGAELWNLLGK